MICLEWSNISRKRLILAKNWGKGDIYFHSFSVLIIHFLCVSILSLLCFFFRGRTRSLSQGKAELLDCNISAKTTVGSIGLKSICELANSVRHTRLFICFMSAWSNRHKSKCLPFLLQRSETSMSNVNIWDIHVFLRHVLALCKFGANWITGGSCAPNTRSGSSRTAEFKDRWRAFNFSLHLFGAHHFPHIPLLNSYSDGLYSWTP